MSPGRKRALLAVALLATLALSWLAPGGDGEASVAGQNPKRRATPARDRAAPAAPPTLATVVAMNDLRATPRPELPAEVPDLFKGLSWYVPPPAPPPPPPPPPPKPTAPPLPFAYLGQYLDGERRLFILNRGDRVLTVAIGDVIDKTYQVDSVSGEQLVFVYLPLSSKQSLLTGGIQ